MLIRYEGETFTETQIVKILKDLDSGKQANDVARENGVSKSTLYNWRKKYSGMGASELSELKALKEENRRLNRIAEATYVCGISSRSKTCKRDHRKKAVRRAALKPAQKRLIVNECFESIVVWISNYDVSGKGAF
ncbi:transposase [Dyadobacter chenwenxiniae]|uniref:transposase n=1 Tax=Dyadobacter chenwenxiniae TaxID=2906456 RepID=UPI0035B69C12